LSSPSPTFAAPAPTPAAQPTPMTAPQPYETQDPLNPPAQPDLAEMLTKKAENIDQQTESSEDEMMNQQVNSFANNDYPQTTAPVADITQNTLNPPAQPDLSSPSYALETTVSTPQTPEENPSAPSLSTNNNTNNDNIASNNKTLADAVNNLMNSNSSTDTDNSNSTITTNSPSTINESPPNTKRIIQPLDSTGPTKSLDQLIAEEEQNSTTTTPSQNPFDPTNPNNISL